MVTIIKNPPGFRQMNAVLAGSLASLLAGLATGLGGALVSFVRRISDKFLDASLGFAAGVMLAASAFGLIVPAIEIGGIWKTVLGIVMGTLFLVYAERFMPRIHRIAGIRGPSTHLSRLWLFVLAITLHNFPEGLAVGAMLLVISEEIIPETPSWGNDREATFGVILGFIVMMVLDHLFI